MQFNERSACNRVVNQTIFDNIISFSTQCNSLQDLLFLDGKTRWLREEHNSESYLISFFFCYGGFSGGNNNGRFFFQNKKFKTIVIIGLALKSLAGIGIKSYHQTHSLTSLVD